MVQIDIVVKVIGVRDMVDGDIMIRVADKDIWTLQTTEDKVTVDKATVAKVMTSRMEDVALWRGAVGGGGCGREPPDKITMVKRAKQAVGKITVDKITVDKITARKITARKITASRNTQALQMDKDTVIKNIGTKVTRDKITRDKITRDKITTAIRLWRKVIIIPQRNGTATQTADAQAQPPMGSSGKIVKAAKMLKQNALTWDSRVHRWLTGGSVQIQIVNVSRRMGGIPIKHPNRAI